VRKKIVLATTAGVLAVGGLAFAVPAVADDDTTTETSATSAEDRIRDALSGLVDDGSLTSDQADEVAATLGDAGLGGGHGHGGSGRGLDLSVAAETLGLSEEDLRTALEADGASLASVAGDRGVAVDDVVAALVQAAQERLDDAVADGRLTQEEADERAADLETRVTDLVDSTDVDRDGPRGGRGGWGGDDGATGGATDDGN
jgi:polyhydroxyalkanoate synthesis regulator phasin